MENLGVSISFEQMREVFNTLDKDKSGTLSYTEFCSMNSNFQQHNDKEKNQKPPLMP